MNLASRSSTRLALGPGIAVTSRGVFTSKVVGMSSSREESKVGVDRTLRGESRHANGRTRKRLAREKKENLVSPRRRVVAAGRLAGSSPRGRKDEFED